MSDAIRIEQRVQHLFAGWRRRGNGRRAGAGDARQMEREAVERLFADRRVGNGGMPAIDLTSARETERDAIEHIYGRRSGSVVRSRPDADDAS